MILQGDTPLTQPKQLAKRNLDTNATTKNEVVVLSYDNTFHPEEEGKASVEQLYFCRAMTWFSILCFETA